jgi:excisionase family DNA binding protein
MNVEMLTPKEVAPLLRVSARHITRMAERKELPAVCMGTGKKKLWRFNRADLEAWIKAQTHGGIRD